MAYPDELLSANERVVIHKHPHWKMLVLPVLVLLVTVGIAAYLASLVSDQSWHVIAWVVLAGLAAIAVIWFTVVPLIRWRTTHFVVTTQRVLVREGVLSRSGIDIPLTRVNSVQFRHSFVQRLLGCGTLVIESASDEPLEFDDIPQVERVHSLLYRELHDDDEPIRR
ncbi:MAG TPA: PH domain-containing protein [Pseudonocardiaceae bacterium]